MAYLVYTPRGLSDIHNFPADRSLLREPAERPGDRVWGAISGEAVLRADEEGMERLGRESHGVPPPKWSESA